jgi:hypothetical protein
LDVACRGLCSPSEQGFSIRNFDKLVHMGSVRRICLSLEPLPDEPVVGAPSIAALFFFLYAEQISSGSGWNTCKILDPGRDYDLADIIADMIGAGLAYGLSVQIFYTCGLVKRGGIKNKPL